MRGLCMGMDVTKKNGVIVAFVLHPRPFSTKEEAITVSIEQHGGSFTVQGSEGQWYAGGISEAMSANLSNRTDKGRSNARMRVVQNGDNLAPTCYLLNGGLENSSLERRYVTKPGEPIEWYAHCVNSHVWLTRVHMFQH